MVNGRRSNRRPPMEVAYEDIRLITTGEISKELMKLELDDDLEDETDYG